MILLIQHILSILMKVYLVTGGNKGIGLAICKNLIESSPDTRVLLGSRDSGRGESAISEITKVLPSAKDRVELTVIDTSSDESVKNAAKIISSRDIKLNGIVNNAGIMSDNLQETLNVNYFGPKRVCDAFGPLLIRPGGRIVNIASASGPFFANTCRDRKMKEIVCFPLNHSINDLDKIAKSYKSEDPYGMSKALLNAYTAIYAKENTDLIVNSCTPGWIKTDMTKGSGASNSPSNGAKCPVHLLLSSDVSTGWYYGSDMKRSPLDRYRSPGEPPYDGS